MSQKLLLLTPPFTQLNTPYPATAYLKGFLNTKKIASYQADLGLEVILKLFSRSGYQLLFDAVEKSDQLLSENTLRIAHLKSEYLKTIDQVIDFLQGNNPTLAHIIADGDFLPEASRFDQLDDLEWAFGTMGTQDKARHLATLYLEDISDLIIEAVDPHFGFSRYAERLGRSATEFDELEEALEQENSFIDDLLIDILKHKITIADPTLIALSVPFPGNLYAALKCGQWIKKNYPNIKVAMGGGYANTELRSLTDPRVFSYLDFITLDDGEAPIYHLIEYLEGQRELKSLKRTYSLEDDQVIYHNGSDVKDYSQREVGTPDYSNFELDKYLSVIEIVNPMHRLWSDGRWNKLTLAHGCYWGKCTFCDISLDYIKIYEPSAASLLCDRIEEIIEQTGENGFHFVDEAAPPSLLKALALEIIRRDLTVVWWTNIRFEKNFTYDLCRLLKASGCIAISGGLEVASDRLLAMIDKGVTVQQVTEVADNFTRSGIMVHAYLMFGFPTQTAQETIDSLEIVRQLFMHGVVQSGFWHQFAMTAHSPVGLNPEQFGVKKPGGQQGAFANNDLVHVDVDGANHEAFSEGLKRSLFNYMHGVCFDFHLSEWFDFQVPKTMIPSRYIENILNSGKLPKPRPDAKVVWTGGPPIINSFKKKKKGKPVSMTQLTFYNKKDGVVVEVPQTLGEWLTEMMQSVSIRNKKQYTYAQLEKDFETRYKGDFKQVWYNHALQELKANGLLVL
ncbi:MAG: B12-binding domain-containing radical SAM protein [Bacteroidota bacterium]